MPTTTTTKNVTQVRPGDRVSLGGINEIRVEFAKHIDGGQMILVGDVFRVGVSGSFLPGYVLFPVNTSADILGTF